MLKPIFLTGVIAMLLCGFAALSMAEEKGNPRKGKYLFRSNCRTCHQDSGTAPYLGPDSKTVSQWQKAFEKKQYSEFKCKAEWEKRSAEELLDIFTYLHKYAADSPSPAKCQ
jgi:cytochrome c2